MFKMHGRRNVTETAVGSAEQDTGERRRKHGSMQRKAIVRREEICQRAVVFQVAHGVLPANNIHADLCKTACVEYLGPESPAQICFVISLPPSVFAVTAEIVEGKGRTGEPRIRCPVWLACVCTTRKKPQRICEASDCLRDDEITSLFSKSADDAADGFAAVSCSALNIIS